MAKLKKSAKQAAAEKKAVKQAAAAKRAARLDLGAAEPAPAEPAAVTAAVPEVVDTDFDRRLQPRCDELKWLYCELYHGDEAAFGYFLAMLRRCWEERKAPLREQDQIGRAHV